MHLIVRMEKVRISQSSGESPGENLKLKYCSTSFLYYFIITIII